MGLTISADLLEDEDPETDVGASCPCRARKVGLTGGLANRSRTLSHKLNSRIAFGTVS